MRISSKQLERAWMLFPIFLPLILIIVVAIPNFFTAPERARRRTSAMNDLNATREILIQHLSQQKKYGNKGFPKNLSEYSLKDHQKLDYWKTPLRYGVYSDNKQYAAFLCSAGENKTWDSNFEGNKQPTESGDDLCVYIK